MNRQEDTYPQGTVALLAEGVDRNFQEFVEKHTIDGSPSSRRAWIEIETERNAEDHLRVALLAEGVDRNFVLVGLVSCIPGRPPRGGRG